MEEQGFGKLNFSSPKPSVNAQTIKPFASMRKRRLLAGNNKRLKKLLRSRKFLVVAGIVLLLGVVSLIKAFSVYNDAMQLRTQAKAAYAAIKVQDVELAKKELVKTQENVEQLQKDLGFFMLVGYIPFVGGYYNDVVHMVNASSYGISAATIATDSLIPYADVLGLKGSGTFTTGSAQDRIRLAVKTLGKVVPRIDEIEVQVSKAKEEIDQVDVNHYPNFWVFKDLRTQIETVKTLTDEGALAVKEGKPLIKMLPELLGESEDKKYLILFQNDKELRPTGGFWTYYAIFRVEQGVITVDKSTNIYDLDDSIPSHPAAPRIIANYLPKVNEWYIRDANISPDFAESVKNFNELYEDSAEYTEVDGVIALDTHFLVHILEILGEVQAGGQAFNAEIDPHCDCPQAVYLLELNTTKPVGYVRENRKSILGDLLFAIMEKALSSSPGDYWGRLVQTAMADAQQKHIMFHLYNKDAQRGVEALGWGGRIDNTFEGDYLHINDANFGGAKSNMFVRDAVKMEYEVDKEGKITKTVTIDYKNPQPYSDCNLESGGLCLNATLRNFQRVYVPKGSDLVKVKGSEVKVKTNEDLGRTYFESFFRVNPLGKAQISYTYTLPFKVEKGQELPVLIQKQGGKDIIPYEIYVNDKKVETFDLTTDKELLLEVR